MLLLTTAIFYHATMSANAMAVQATPPAPVSASEPSLDGKGSAPPGQGGTDHGDPEILVVADRLPGVVDTPYKPILRLDKNAIQALGAPSLKKLMERIQSVTRAAGGGAPVLLLNGRRIANEEDIASLPPEAIEQLEVLPEPVAAQFGYSPKSRVTNIITARRFTSLAADATVAADSSGSGLESRIAGAGTLLRRDFRSFLTIDRLTRPGVEAQGLSPSPNMSGRSPNPYATLSPAEDTLTFKGSAAGPIGKDLNGSVTVNLDSTGQSRSAPAEGDTMPNEPAVSGREFARTTTFRTTAMVQGFLADWTWNTTLNLDRAHSRQVSAFGAARSQTLSRGSNFNGNLVFSANGPVATLPAGRLLATVSAGARTESAASSGLTDINRIRLRRHTSNVSLGLTLPLTEPDRSALTLNVSAEASQISGQGRLAGWSANMSANPHPGLYLSVNYARSANAPTLSQAAGPAIVLSGTPFFDYRTGRTVIIDQITGGNPDLRAERKDTLDLGFDLQPFPDKPLRVAATYSLMTVNQGIATIGTSNRLLETAFPNLYRRDAAGTLISISSVPVNLQSIHQHSITGSLSYSGDIVRGDPGLEEPNAAMREPVFLLLSLDGTYRMKDVVRIAPGLPPLDLLNGAALDSFGGRPRLEIAAVANLSSAKLGGDVSARWQSSTRQSGDSPENDLVFSSRLTVQAGLFLNMEAIVRSTWTRGLRFDIAAENLFDSRQRVRARNGDADYGLALESLDPRGRIIRLSLRKLF